ncbi:MAG: hypothetical protein KAI72_06150, partial [Candidatus Pacebacteria bacterium]|nr:hypothetical protein [Candidatus Paceibacterota bacterium]
MKKSIFKKSLSVALAILIATPSLVIAASLTDLSDEMSTLKVSELSSHEIMFATPSGVQYTETVIITFASDFAIGSLEVADVDIEVGDSDVCSSAGWTDQTVAAAAASSVWGVATTSSTITFTAPDDTSGQVTAGNCMRIQLGTSAAGGSNEITNTTTTGSKTIAYTGTFGDTGTTTVQMLTDDQVAVTAEVPQSLTFSITNPTIGFGDLSATQDRYANTTGGSDTEVVANTITAGTNASSGYSITVKGATLTNGSNTITAIGGVHAATSTGSEQFGIRVSASGGDGIVSDPYDDAAQYAYGATASVTDVVATATESTANTDYSVRYVANIASDTEAGSYST